MYLMVAVKDTGIGISVDGQKYGNFHYKVPLGVVL
jgi:hypothetical protein